MLTHSDWIMTGYNECKLNVYPIGFIEIREISTDFYIIEAFNERMNFDGEFAQAQYEAIEFAQELLADAMRAIEDMN